MNVKSLRGTNKRNGHCCLLIEGDMTIYNANDFRDSLAKYAEDYREFNIDISGVNEIDTAGIQLLLQFIRKAQSDNSSINITGSNNDVYNMFELYQLQDVLMTGDGNNEYRKENCNEC